jgi:hypothetical protein
MKGMLIIYISTWITHKDYPVALLELINYPCDLRTFIE